MTTLEKKQFFALYIESCEITWDREKGFPCRGLNTISDMKYIIYNCINVKLELKSLSNISDEDAIEVAKMNTSVNWNTGRKEHVWKNSFGNTVVSNGSGIVQKYGQIIVNDLQHLSLQQCDHLRSKGYALSWKQYTVEDLISNGVVKLI